MPFSGGSGADDAFDYLFKIILIGDSNVGKTCVVHRFKTGQFSEKQQNTIGVDFTVRSLDLDGKRVKIQVWDTAGQERFRTITQSYYRSAHGAILAYDLTRRSTFESIPHWIREIEKYGAANLVMMLIGNKSDSVDKRQVLFEPILCVLPRATTMMKLPVAALLLLCACGLQAALTKREAVPEAGAEAPPDAAIPLSRHFQTFSDFVTKELPQKLQAEELRNQAKAYLEQANQQLTPLAQELRTNVLNFFSSLLELGKAKEQA